MEYNTSRPRMIIPEYGRNVQKMVDHLLSIENREERNRQAQNLIDIIGNLNPQIRDVPDFKHKLWDHLFIMSEFKLDVDSPYPKPTAESFQEKPELLDYPDTSRRYRHYGNILRKMVKYAAEQEDGEIKQHLLNAIGNHMKKTYLIWNKDTVEDEVILNEMNEIAGGKLDLSGINLQDKQDLVRGQQPQQQRRFSHKNQRHKGRKKFKSNK